MFCTKCGTELPDGATFCTNCGAKLAEGSPAVQTPAANTTGTPAVSVPKVAVRQKSLVVPIVAAVAIIGLAIALFMTGGFGLFGGSGVEVKAKTNDYTWEELSAISAEISRAGSEDGAIEVAKKYHLCNEDGTLDGTQTKTITMAEGVKTKVQIVGFNHDDKADGSGKAGITFVFSDVIMDWQMNPGGSNDGGWQDSAMRSWLPGWIEDVLPEEVLDVVVAVNKKTNNTGETKNTSSVTETKDSFWLLSFNEVAGPITEERTGQELDSDIKAWSSVLAAEGSQYKLYRDEAVVPFEYNDVLKKSYASTTSSTSWLLRSPDPSYLGDFCYVYSGGYSSSDGNASNPYGVVPGFCI